MRLKKASKRMASSIRLIGTLNEFEVFPFSFVMLVILSEMALDRAGMLTVEYDTSKFVELLIVLFFVVVVNEVIIRFIVVISPVIVAGTSLVVIGSRVVGSGIVVIASGVIVTDLVFKLLVEVLTESDEVKR